MHYIIRVMTLVVSLLASSVVALVPTTTVVSAQSEPGVFLNDNPGSLIKWQTGHGQRYRFPRPIGPMQCLLITAAGVQIGGQYVGHQAGQNPLQDVVVAVNGESMGVGANVVDVNEGQVDVPKPFQEQARKSERIQVADMLANRFSPPHGVKFYIASANNGLWMNEVSREVFWSSTACPPDP